MISTPELSAGETSWKQDFTSEHTFDLCFFCQIRSCSLLHFVLARNKDNVKI